VNRSRFTATASRTAAALRAVAGAPTLFLSAAAVTAILLAWTHEWARGSTTHGLSPIFFYLFTDSDAVGLQGALLILCAAALFTAAWKRAGSTRGAWRLALSATALPNWLGRHPLRVASLTAVVFSWGAWTVYRHWPLCMDEYAAVFQSQIFAAGHVAGHFPPQLLDWLIPRGFQDYFLNVVPATGAVTSSYWPSFALLLTPFTWLGIPWVCNPLLSAATLVATHRLALRLFGDREAAGLAVLLTLASPEFFADGISYYSMSAHALANTLYALLLVAPAAAAPTATLPSPRKACLAGVVGSIALTLHNPVPHTLFALPWILWLVSRPGGIRATAWLFAGYLPLAVLLGLGWFFATSPSGNVAALTAPFAFPNGTVVLMRLAGIAKLWAWAVPGLLILAVAGAWNWRRNSACLLLACSALLTLLGYFFVPVDQGHGWGYRYFHTAWIALPILAVAALKRPLGVAPARQHLFADGTTRRFIVACAILSLLGATTLRAVQIHGFIARHQRQIPAYAGSEHRVVILNTQHTFYGRDLVQNDPWLRENTITLITHGASADAAMMHANFPAMHPVYADRFGAVWSAGSAN
jgi:hypothetical protein